MKRRYIMVSDLHLFDNEHHADLWKEYKESKYNCDDDFSYTLQSYADETASDYELVLILNGDIIDFDLISIVPTDPPFPVSKAERRHGLNPTEEKSLWKLKVALRDHPVFLQSLARVLHRGGKIIYTIGNHDPEMHFSSLQAYFKKEVTRAGRTLGITVDGASIHFESWFYYVPGEVYVCHGQQYDYFNAFKYILDPVIHEMDPPEIAVPMGNLSNRLLMSQMGFFSPFNHNFLLGFGAYIKHWFNHYAFSKDRSLIFSWLLGSVAVLRTLFRRKRVQQTMNPESYRSKLIARANSDGLTLEQIQSLDGLKRTPIADKVFSMLHTFWLDRLLGIVLILKGTLILWFSNAPIWAKIMFPFFVFPVLFAIYERLVQGESLHIVDRRIRDDARRIATLLPVQVVVFGHTHRPEVIPLMSGVSYANTGTWAPVMKDVAGGTLKPGYRNTLVVEFDDGELTKLRLESQVE